MKEKSAVTMGRFTSFTLFLASLVLPAATAPLEGRSVVSDKYIITLKQGASVADIPSRLGRRAADVEKVYDIPGFAAYSGTFDAEAIEEIANDETVAAVEPVGIVETQEVQEDAPWGLGSISHRTPDHTDYLYNFEAGEGGYAYVIDTGLYVEHEAFANGKGVLGYNAYPGTEFEDVVGHGTHCAGTIVSEQWGVAKNATAVSVKVFDDGSSTYEIVLDGYTWAVNDIIEKGIQGSSVISMSLSGGRSTAVNSALAAAYAQGITTVVAAGNYYSDASSYSPASEPTAITVGAVDVSNAKPSWSNYGDVLDVFAPGVSVLSAWIGSPTATNTISGTSMATPHVAGLVLYLQSVYGITAPADIAATIADMGTPSVLTSIGTGSPDLLAFNGYGEY